MNKLIKLGLIGAMSFLGTVCAFAQGDSIQITSYGLFANNVPYSCGKFVADDSTNFGKEQWKLWIAGYISGMNSARWRATNNVDVDGMYLWVQNYCKSNPLAVFETALKNLDSELGVGQFPIYSDRFLKKKN